jgi:hypothetical protein
MHFLKNIFVTPHRKRIVKSEDPLFVASTLLLIEKGLKPTEAEFMNVQLR